MTSDKGSPHRDWAELPERGTPGMLRIIFWVALHLGRNVARLVLYPISFYFVLTASDARRASREYLARLRGRYPKWFQVLRHFQFFSATVLDRIYLLKGDFDLFDIKLHNADVLHRSVETGKGCILVGSHLGSFEAVRAIGVTQRDVRIKVLMDRAHNENITRLMDALNRDIADTVIAPDQPDTLLRVKENLDAGFVVGTLGDRASSDSKNVQCQFLGAPAMFPAGPIVLAAMTRRPVVLFFGLYRGRNRYDIYFEQFADEIVLDREQRMEQVQQWMQRYANRLEHYARSAPYNWFNFYPFWNISP